VLLIHDGAHRDEITCSTISILSARLRDADLRVLEAVADVLIRLSPAVAV
jgi:hypothetical protein